MKRLVIITLIIFVVCALIGAALLAASAGTIKDHQLTIDEHRTSDYQGSAVKITGVSSDIDVIEGDKLRLDYTGTVSAWGVGEARPPTLVIKDDGEVFVAEIEYPDQIWSRLWFSADDHLLVTVPSTITALEITTVSGDVNVQRNVSSLKITGVSSDVKSAFADTFTVETVSGDVQFKARTLKAQSVSGNLKGRAEKGVVETVSGDVWLNVPEGVALSFETTSGELDERVHTLNGDTISVHTVSGDLTIE